MKKTIIFSLILAFSLLGRESFASDDFIGDDQSNKYKIVEVTSIKDNYESLELSELPYSDDIINCCVTSTYSTTDSEGFCCSSTTISTCAETCMEASAQNDALYTLLSVLPLLF